MPLARIFTQHPERAASLSEELHHQGYEVELRSPDQIHLSPADLEIEFEICDRADVLERAAGLADELQADVAVAPGVLPPATQPVAEPAPIPPMARDSAERMPVEAAAAETQAVQAEAVQDGTVHAEAVHAETQQSDREREFEAAFAAQSLQAGQQLPPVIENPVVEYAALPPVMEIPVMESTPEPEPLPPVAFADEPAIPEPVAAKTADPVPYLSQLMPFSLPPERPPAEERDQDARPGIGEPDIRKSGKAAARSLGQSAAGIFSTAMAGAKSITASGAESFREWLQEYKKRAQVRSAEARAARVARMLDLEQRTAEAQQRAAELEAAREAAAARLLELVRQREPGLREESSRPESLRLERKEDSRKAEPVVKPPAARTPVESLRHAWIASLRTRQRPFSPQLRAVLTGAAAVSVLFVIGIVLGELYPSTPAAHTADRSYNGATVQGGTQTGGATLQGGAQAGGVTLKMGPPPAQPAPQPLANAAPAQGKPSPKVGRRATSQQSADTVGDDVVIRHFSRSAPAATPRQSGQQAGLKRFSDMEN